MILSALLLLAASAPNQIDWQHPYGNHVELVDGGLCVGLAWVKLLPGEVATVDYGPDFNVYRVHGPGDEQWGAYSGFAGQSSPDVTHLLLTKDGVSVYRGVGSDGSTPASSFDGYFVAEKDNGFESQNHFFGTMFKDAPSDARFFDRVVFGSAAKAKCESNSNK